jgi:ElaA protein
MELIVKSFSELSTGELYEILKSRLEIFMLEQNIICQDLDDVDYVSTHYFFMENNRVVAYLRAFEGEEKDVMMMGRVLTLDHKKGVGRELMTKAIEHVKKTTNYQKISLHAQKSAIGFYEKLGFLITSPEFLEEGVVHVTMDSHR